MESLAPEEFTSKTTFLNTANTGLLPTRTVDGIQQAARSVAEGTAFAELFELVERSRESFARLAGVQRERVATGSSVSLFAALVAAALPTGADVLTAEGDFTSVVTPFHVRADLTVRTVPLDRLAASVRPGTALVAVSAVQSADGRITDLTALRAAARAHGARTFVDATQSAGWLPLDATQFDYVAVAAFKWLLSPRGAAFLVVPEDHGGLAPLFAGWAAAEHPEASYYGPVTELARSARRFDESPALFSFVGAHQSLALIEELGTATIRAHDLALADRFRAGLDRIGTPALPAPGSAIVSVPGLGERQPELHRAGIEVSNRAGSLRAAFHLYNSAADVDRLLDELEGGAVPRRAVPR